MCLNVCERGRKWEREPESKTKTVDRAMKLCHYASIKQNAWWCHSAVFVRLDAFSCVYVGELMSAYMCMCCSWQGSHSLQKQTVASIFSERSKKRHQVQDKKETWVESADITSASHKGSCVSVYFCVRIVYRYKEYLHDRALINVHAVCMFYWML